MDFGLNGNTSDPDDPGYPEVLPLMICEDVPLSEEQEQPTVDQEPSCEQELTTSEQELPTSEQEPPPSEKELPTSAKELPSSELELPSSEQEPPTMEQELPTSEQEPPSSEKGKTSSETQVPSSDPLESSGSPKPSQVSDESVPKDVDDKLFEEEDEGDLLKIDQVIGGLHSDIINQDNRPSQDVINIDSDASETDPNKDQESLETAEAIRMITESSDSNDQNKDDVEAIDLCSDDEEPQKQKPRLKVKSFLTEHKPAEEKSAEEVIITGQNEGPDLPLEVIVNEVNEATIQEGKLEDYQIPVVKCQARLETCFQCNGYILCPLTLKISDKSYFLCSDQCHKDYRQAEKATKLIWAEKFYRPINVEVLDTPRTCQVCSKEVDDSCLSWEAMDFCKDICLMKYQKSIGSNCKKCSNKVSPLAFGKYCIRFGGSILQFCAMSCLNAYKNSSKYCFFCQNDLSTEDDIVTKPRCYFREFCNTTCLLNLENILNKPKSKVTVANCAVCAKSKLAAVEVISETEPVQLCSDICMSAFKFRNRMKVGHCYTCKRYYDKEIIKEIVIFQDGQPLSYCSLNCMNINILMKRDIVPCCYCKAKKYNFDMIIQKTYMRSSVNSDLPMVEAVNYLCSLNCYNSFLVLSTGKQNKKCTHCKKETICLYTLNLNQGQLTHFCSHECVSEYSASKNTELKKVGPPPLAAQPKLVTKTVKASSTQVVKNQVANILVRPRDHVEVKNKMTMVSNPPSKNKAVSVHPFMNARGTQTDECSLSGLIPVPVPIYVPCPMAMYSLPSPTLLPIPVPVPVPIFIPTTKNNYKEVLEEINRIVEKTPRDPIEAELLIMAEMVAEDKDSAPASNFITDEVMEGSNSCDDMLQMALKMASDLEDAPDLDQSLDSEERKRRCDGSIDTTPKRRKSSEEEKPDSNMSLKFTLGVNAWKFFSKNWNKEIEAGKEGRPVKTDLLSMTSVELNTSLILFLKEAKMGSGSEYKPDVKLYLMLGIQYYLSESGRIDNIFCDFSYTNFIDAFDQEAIRFQRMYPNPEDGAISRVEEEHLWESRHLGAHSPYSLLIALIYFNTKLFNLTTVEEHLQLSFSTVSKQWRRNMDSTPPHSGGRQSTESRSYYLKFSPTQLSMEMNPKMKRTFEQPENKENPYRCPVRLYNFYISKCPASVIDRSDMFYLEPERSGVAHSPCWYSNKALAEKTIRNILNRVKMVKQINQSMQTDKFL